MWSVRLDLANFLTGKGYKEYHWLVIPHQPLQLSPPPSSLLLPMPSSSRTIPGTQNQFSIGHAAVRVRGQTSNRTNAGRAITPFMFNEEGYRVSDRPILIPHELTQVSVCP